ncbi:MAG: superoxide dismutase [Sedimentisphaerales bacterium]|nr:superoxide dismutase [Sedimentisphaerales bacterium]
MNYKVPNLRFTCNALEPFLNEHTLQYHYQHHHQDYVTRLNDLLELCPTQIRNKPLEDIIADISVIPGEYRQGIRNYGGGHLNHSLWWQILSPPHTTHPQGELLKTINFAFGGFDNFKAIFKRIALERFGSGWTWLGMDHLGKIDITSTPNEDSPIMLGFRPLLGIDLWEHAYYLNYQHRRGDYINAWWHVIDWSRVSQLFDMYRETILHPK